MATKKRVHFSNGEDEEEQEDQKIEQFFALVRNFHEARHRRKDELMRRQEEKRKEKNKTAKQNKMRKVDDEKSSWVPTFERADFTEGIEFGRPALNFPNPYNNKKDDNKKQEDNDGLDLRLTL